MKNSTGNGQPRPEVEIVAPDLAVANEAEHAALPLAPPGRGRLPTQPPPAGAELPKEPEQDHSPSWVSWR